MSRSTIPPADDEAPYSREPWAIDSVLLLEGERSVVEVMKAEILARASCDIERVRTADEALDMIGFARRPFDLVILGSAEVREDGQHVLRMLRRQRSPSIVLGFHLRELPPDFPWDVYAGLANWLDIALTSRWTDAVGRAIRSRAGLKAILESGRVPADFDPQLARRVYGADPGEPFVLGLTG